MKPTAVLKASEYKNNITNMVINNNNDNNLEVINATLFTTKRITETMEVRITYSVAQQPLKSIDRPLVRVSLSDSILIILIFY